jgi:uncharacterized membrane protein HdeD (DUF308 family)
MNNPLKSFTNGIKALGLVFILGGIGVFAISIFVPSLIGAIVAILLMVAGGIRITYALVSRSESGFWLKLISGILYGIAGLVLLTGVFQRYLSVSFILGAILILEGLLELTLALRLQPGTSRRWLFVSSAAAFVVGLLFIIDLGVSTAWLLGLLAGLSLVTPGVWFIILAQTLQESKTARRRRTPRL